MNFRDLYTMNSIIFAVVYTSISLAFLFGGYNIISEYLTVVYGDFGFYAYVTIYLSNIIGSLFAPFIAFHLIGVKWSIITGACAYFLWITIFNLHSIILLMIASVANGIGSGLLRSQQNVWISSVVDSGTINLPSGDKQNQSTIDKGKYIGIFNTIFSFNGIFSSIIFVVVLFYNYTLDFLIYVFSIVSLVSVIMLLFIKSVELSPKHTISTKLLVNTMKQSSFLLLCPLIIFQSVGNIFTYAILPKFMDENNLAIAITFLIYSIIYAIGSYLIGILCDRIRTIWLVSVVCANAFVMVAYICFLKFLEYKNYRVIIGYIGIGFFTGISDSAINSILIYVFSVNYNNKTIFSLHRAVYSLFCAIYAIIAIFSIWYISIFIYCTSSLIGMMCFRKSMQIFIENKKEIYELVEMEEPADFVPNPFSAHDEYAIIKLDDY